MTSTAKKVAERSDLKLREILAGDDPPEKQDKSFSELLLTFFADVKKVQEKKQKHGPI